MKANLIYTHDASIGYGHMATELHKALARAGVEIIDQDLGEGYAEGAAVAIWASLPSNNTGWYEGQYRVLLTMWETASLPESMREGLHNFDMVMVPSKQNLELFEKRHPNVVRLPLGVDPVRWKYTPRQPVGRTFRFLADGRGKRKGTDLVVKAFFAAFKDRVKETDPRPTLTLKARRPPEYQLDGIMNVTSSLTPEQEVQLYESAHCFVAPARGEGWGLQPLQAIAQGLPTILTDAHGQAEFAWLGHPISTTMSRAEEYVMFGEAGDWWEPNLDELVDQMRWVYDEYEAALNTAASASTIARRDYSWDTTARRAIELIGKDRLNEPYVAGPLVIAEYKRYPVKVLFPHHCEIAGHHLYFTPGQLTYEVADVKRILFEARVLDPACYEIVNADDVGLSAKQMEQRGEVSAATAWCPTCGQQLGSKPLYDVDHLANFG